MPSRANSSLHRLVLSEADGRVKWIPRLVACGTSLGMTSKKDASLGMSVGTVRLAKNLSLKVVYMPSLHCGDPVVVGAGFIPARAKSIPCFLASKRRALNEMMWSVSRPRSATPD